MPVSPTAPPNDPTILVVDSAAIAAVLFDEPISAAVGARLAGGVLAAPAVLPVELGHVCVKKMRRDPAAAARLAIAYDARALLGIALHEVDHDDVLSLAHAVGLSFYDACYLWLARRLGAELVTLDARLTAAAGV